MHSVRSALRRLEAYLRTQLPPHDCLVLDANPPPADWLSLTTVIIGSASSPPCAFYNILTGQVACIRADRSSFRRGPEVCVREQDLWACHLSMLLAGEHLNLALARPTPQFALGNMFGGSGLL